jgi:hypothetical protein
VVMRRTAALALLCALAGVAGLMAAQTNGGKNYHGDHLGDLSGRTLRKISELSRLDHSVSPECVLITRSHVIGAPKESCDAIFS